MPNLLGNVPPLKRRAATLLAVVALAALPTAAQMHLRADRAKSNFRIELGRAGLLKALGDDHLIRVNDYDCDVALDEATPANSTVHLTVRATSLEVLDPNLSVDKRTEVQKKMLGPEVLDAPRYSEIRFVSRKVTMRAAERFYIEGDLTIRDTTRPVVMEVHLTREGTTRLAEGEARVRLTDFHIQPPSAGAGAVKVKDEMKISFRLVLVPAQH